MLQVHAILVSMYDVCRLTICPQRTDPSKWNSSPACTELEAIVMDWAAQLLGLSPAFLNASGVGGGSIQVLSQLS
jgi:Pyridoxal-dependent decarboxylase conserved domain